MGEESVPWAVDSHPFTVPSENLIRSPMSSASTLYLLSVDGDFPEFLENSINTLKHGEFQRIGWRLHLRREFLSCFGVERRCGSERLTGRDRGHPARGRAHSRNPHLTPMVPKRDRGGCSTRPVQDLCSPSRIHNGLTY